MISRSIYIINYCPLSDKITKRKTIQEFYGESPKDLKSITKIVNKHHFERLHNLLKDSVLMLSLFMMVH